jgi:phospholipase C
MQKLTRRELLRLGVAATAAELTGFALHGCGGGSTGMASMPSTPAACSKLTDIEHVVILIQENRSFDHYFGSYRGVRGFSDPSMAYQQPNPANTTSPPIGKLLPFHLDTTTTNAACTHDITHDWVSQHQSWDSGAMDGFVTSRMAANANDAVLTMGYYNRADIPYYYALADAFTICDNYFCSVIGPTDPNRLYTMAASIDPDGKNGGPVLETIVTNRSAFYGKLTYTTMPEQLQARGISWKVYSSPDETILPELSGSFVTAASECVWAAIPHGFPGGHRFQQSAAGFVADWVGGDVGSSACAVGVWRKCALAHRGRVDGEFRGVGEDRFLPYVR